MGNEHLGFFAFFAIFAVVVLVPFLIFFGVRRQYESKRTEALRSVAFSLGMSFEDWRDIDATQRFGPFQLFSRGSDEKVRNCMSGTIDGADVTTFGYDYEEEDPTDDGIFTRRRQTVALFRSDELSLPAFELRPRSFFDKLDDLIMGRNYIDFESHPDFSKSYILTGNDESAIRHVFSRSVLQYFDNHSGLSIEGRDETLLCYRTETLATGIGFRGARVKPDELKLFIDEGRVVFDLFRREDSPPQIKRETELQMAGTTTGSMGNLVLEGSRIGNALAWIFGAIFSLLFLIVIVTLALK